QMGLFIGFTFTTSGVIDHSGADIWIASKGVPYLEAAVPFSERKLYELLAISDVDQAEKLIVRLIAWKRTDGAQEGIIVVGFNPEADFGGPWNVVKGLAGEAAVRDAVFIDQLYRSKLGINDIGDRAEINGVRARIAGFTKRIRSFTTSP